MSNKKIRNINKRIKKATEECNIELTILNKRCKNLLELYNEQKRLNYKRENIIMKLMRIIMQIDIIMNENCKLEKMSNVKAVFDKIREQTNNKNVGNV